MYLKDPKITDINLYNNNVYICSRKCVLQNVSTIVHELRALLGLTHAVLADQVTLSDKGQLERRDLINQCSQDSEHVQTTYRTVRVRNFTAERTHAHFILWKATGSENFVFYADTKNHIRHTGSPTRIAYVHCVYNI